MPSVQQHIQQANHNERLRQQLDTLNIIDWTITVMFYTALHKVDAFLANVNIHPKKHTSGDPNDFGRNQYVNTFFPLDKHKSYCRLYNASRNARYEVTYLGTNSRNYYERLLQNDFNHLDGYLDSVLP